MKRAAFASRDKNILKHISSLFVTVQYRVIIAERIKIIILSEGLYQPSWLSPEHISAGISY